MQLPGYYRVLILEVSMLFIRNHVTTCYSGEWYLFTSGFYYELLLLKGTMYSYYKRYAKNGSHKMTAIF